MMRRLLLILLAWLACVPLLPMPVQASHRHVAACAACPMSHDRDAGCADHGCCGCATEAEPATSVSPSVPTPVVVFVARAFAPPAHHRPGFDPPPPRGDG